MGKPARRGFLHLLFSPHTLVPVLLGAGSAAAVWQLRLFGADSTRLAIFLAVAGGLGGLGTLLTLAVVGGKAVEPAVQKKRRELLAMLDALAEGVQRPPAPDKDDATPPAAVERA
ncbi:MAG TPA: hypothetical protein VMS17_10940 [Gemmataceae bacterium]|nr:hypothetical protein [Gemmataceae bacterium]